MSYSPGFDEIMFEDGFEFSALDSAMIVGALTFYERESTSYLVKQAVSF